MYYLPDKIINNKIVRNRQIVFDTATKTKDNAIIIPGDYEDMFSVITSKFIKPQQLMCSFVPRLFKLMDRWLTYLDQKLIYKDISVKTNGRIKVGRTNINSYGDLNILYNMTPEFNMTKEKVAEIKPNALSQQRYISTYLEDKYEKVFSTIGYSKNYIIFPMNKFIEDFRSQVYTVGEIDFEPIIFFLKSIRHGTINLEKYKNVTNIIFYNIKANAIIKIDINDPLFIEEYFDKVMIQLIRMNNFNNADIDDDLSDIDTIDSTDDDVDIKEKIKGIVLTRVSKSLKVNLTDFDAASKAEQEILIDIENKLDEVLDGSLEGVSLEDLVSKVMDDASIKTKAIKFIESKKISQQRLKVLTKNIERETEILADLSKDIVTDDKKIEPQHIEIEGVDRRVQESLLSSFDEQYQEKQGKEDLMSIVSSFSSNDFMPITISDINIEDTSDDFNKKETMKVRYKTEEGKSVSFTIDIPKFVDKRYFYLGGNKKLMTKQMTRLPICKTKEDRVEITTNFNKMIIERSGGKISRKNSYIVKILKSMKGSSEVDVAYNNCAVVNAEYTNDFEFEELSTTVMSITTEEYRVMLSRYNSSQELDILGYPESAITSDMTPFAFNKNNDMFFIEEGAIYKTTLASNGTVKEKFADDMFEFICGSVLKLRDYNEKLPTIGKSFIYSNMKMLGVRYPIFAIVGLREGLSNILRRYNVKHTIYEKGTYSNTQGWVEIKFKDKSLVYEDTIRNTLLLNITYKMDTENYLLSEFDTEKPYLDFIIDKMGQPLYVKNNIKLNLDVWIDPITYSVLKDLKLPTDIVDLLLLANTMLQNNTYRMQNDVRNFRIRSNEIIYGMLYYIVAMSVVGYRNMKMNGKNADYVEVKKNALISQLLQSPNVNDMSTLNPALEVENIATVSAKGHRGINLSRAYGMDLRAYDPNSMVGIFGNGTPVGGGVGVVRYMSYNPKIENVRGYIPTIDQNSLSAANMLSPTEMLQSFCTVSADPPRQAMALAQARHTMPIKKPSRPLISSGVTKTIPYMISDDFCFKAKDSGVVENIDNSNELVILQYDNGEKDAIDIGSKFSKNSNSGFYIRQAFEFKHAVGYRFTKSEILAYDANFFKGLGKDVEYAPGCLSKIAIAPADFCFEDATIISDSLSDKCASKVTMVKQIALGKNAIIHKLLEAGTPVKKGDDILEFTASYDDPSATDLINNLNDIFGDEDINIGGDAIHAKYSGTVAFVNIYYNLPLEEFSDSIQRLISKFKSKSSQRKDAIRGINAEHVRILPVEKQDSDRVGSTKYEGLLIEFGVEYYDTLGEGDKISFSTALKGVVSKKIPIEESPMGEHRPENRIESILTPSGITSRMTIDIFKLLFGNKVLAEVGMQIKEIMEGKR